MPDKDMSRADIDTILSGGDIATKKGSPPLTVPQGRSDETTEVTEATQGADASSVDNKTGSTADTVNPESSFEEPIDQTREANTSSADTQSESATDDSTTFDLTSEDLDPLASPSPAAEIVSLLDKDLEKINSPEKKKLSERAFNWLQKNSELRLCTGIAVSGIAAFTGMNAALVLARTSLGVAGGAVGWSGFKSFMRERGALKEYESKFKDCFDPGGNIDKVQLQEKIDKGEIKREDVIDLYSMFTEVASAKGKVIEKLEQKEQTTNAKLDELFPHLKENKLIQRYSKLHWGWKAAIAVVGSVAASVGAGYVGAAVAGSYGASVVGINLARVLTSGAVQLGLGMWQKSPENDSHSYAHSNKVLDFKNILEKKFDGDLKPEELTKIRTYREDVKKGRIKDAVTGGLVVGTLIGGAYAIFGHNGIGHPGHTTNGSSANESPNAEGKPGVPEPAHAGKPLVPPPLTGFEKPSVPGAPDAIKQAIPDQNQLPGAPKFESMKIGDVELKSNYFANPENLSANADKHLAETIIRGAMGKPEEYGPMPFQAHGEFEALRDKLVEEMHKNNPGAFNQDGSANINHILPTEGSIPILLHEKDIKAGYAEVDALKWGETAKGSLHDGNEATKTGRPIAETGSQTNADQHVVGATHARTEASTAEQVDKEVVSKINQANIDPAGKSFEKATTLSMNQVNKMIDPSSGSKYMDGWFGSFLRRGIEHGYLKEGDIRLMIDQTGHPQMKADLSHFPSQENTGINSNHLGIPIKGIPENAGIDSVYKDRPWWDPRSHTVKVNTEDALANKAAHGAGTPMSKPEEHPKVNIAPETPHNPTDGVLRFKAEDVDPTTKTDFPNSSAGQPHENIPQTPVETKLNGAPLNTPEIPSVQDTPLNSTTLMHVDTSHNYLVNIQGQDPMSVPGTQVSQMVEEAKKYFVDHNAKFENSSQESHSIMLYVLDHLKKKE